MASATDRPRQGGEPDRFEPRPLPSGVRGDPRDRGGAAADAGEARATDDGAEHRTDESGSFRRADRRQTRPSGMLARQRRFMARTVQSSTRTVRPWPTWLPWVLGILLLAAWVVPALADRSSAETIEFSAVLEKAQNGQVDELVFTNGTGKISGSLIDGTRFRSTGPSELGAADRETLRTAALRFRANPVDGNSRILDVLIPAAILLGAFLLLRQRNRGPMQSVMGIGRSKAKLWTVQRPTSRFSDIAGYDAVKGEVGEIIDALRNPKKYADIGANSPKGVLLVGPPGTGKTLIARALAGEASVPFLSVTGSDFMEMFVGVGASRVRDLFETARSNAPCIMFIDEIDGVGRKRGAGLGGGHDEREQTLNQMLAEMDGFDQRTNVVVVAATNRPDVLDPALLRPGRFDRQVVVPLPDRSERRAILAIHGSHRRLDPKIDLDAVAVSAAGMSGADLANLMNEAALAAVRRNAREISAQDIETARDRVLLGQQRDSLVMTDREREITAYHEAGHALLAELLDHADPVHKVSIIPRGVALGVTMQLPEEDRHAYPESVLRDRICVAMGGRVAEFLVFAHRSTGASNDLVTSTELARRMVREWGMSEAIGPMAWGAGGQVFLGEDLMQSRDYADAISQRIDAEVERLLRAEEARATSVLTEHRAWLDRVAKSLLEHETLDGAALRALLNH